MTDKRQVFVTLHYRDELSLGEHRQRLGLAAYHWGILISPKVSKGRDYFTYDISNGVRTDPNTRINLNPQRNWYFRPSSNVDPELSGHLLRIVMIGKLPNDVEESTIRSYLKDLPLPRKEMDNTYVTWIRSAITTLQKKEHTEKFDLNEFMVFALGFAD